MMGEDGKKERADKEPLNFTKAAIEALPVPAKGAPWKYYYDTKVSGLAIGIGPSGVKTFVLYRKVNRKPERIKIGRYPDLTVDKARTMAVTLISDIAGGANPAELKRARRTEMTFGDLFDQYHKNHSVPHKKTADEDKQKFDKYLSNNKEGINLASRRLSEITKAEVAQLFAKISKSHRVTANRVLALVSSIFGKAIEWGIWNQINPCQGIRKHSEVSRDRFLQPDELPKFFEQVLAYPNVTVRDYILISLLTGARRSNVLAMNWNDVNLERAEWRIRETKNGTPQSVPLVPDAIAILEARKNSAACSDSEFVFPGAGESGHLVEPKKAWKIILDKAGIADLRLHDLRRTMGSWQAGTGANLSVIGRSLNHKSTQTTAIYARLWMEPVRNSMETATTAMMQAAGLVATDQSESEAAED
ncbi:tyrosine-type recombinase/integrase [Paraburkholderia silvatlantica]|uniref:tyrosine-type recombinase/integrase n=1 Tax=Paraburkholderia silvatlantica TaxID=321895 RepID=UPI0010EA6964|nr:site-specific integrase [Paraburkholderia silvatlantica]TDQ93255.1 site-specific recombinase XerD [Paraburkholderia silvatlantica]